MRILASILLLNLLGACDGAWRKCSVVLNEQDCSKTVYLRILFQADEDVDEYLPFKEPVRVPHNLRLLADSGMGYYMNYGREFFPQGEGCFSRFTDAQKLPLARDIKCPIREPVLRTDTCDSYDVAADHIPLSTGAQAMYLQLTPAFCPPAPCRLQLELCAQAFCQVEHLKGQALVDAMCSAARDLAPSAVFWLPLLATSVLFSL